MHKPIFLNHISLRFPNKICFEDFSAQIHYGSRIALIGNNGAGKSALLKIICGAFEASDGEVLNNSYASFGYVPQLIYDYENLSGGEKFNKALSAALSKQPDILLLDEPTNHLDIKNRSSLMKMLSFYKGTIIAASHDEELLRNCINTLWHIEQNHIKIFNGNYDDYKNSVNLTRQSLQNELLTLKKEKKEAHLSLMKEQQRAKHSKERGEKLVRQKRWLPAVGDAKQSAASKTAGKRNVDIGGKKREIQERLSSIGIAEIIKPSFSLNVSDIGNKTIVSISSGGAGYYIDGKVKEIVKNISFYLLGKGRLALTGDNGSGKSTIFKAILNEPQIAKSGFWDMPNACDIGFLDQYYSGLDSNKTVLATIQDLRRDWTIAQLRDFLNDFLFRKNEDVNKNTAILSGGEKARLCLAKIAAKTPKLLLLDEITNNIDLQTREHIEEVLTAYEGALIVISHDMDFLDNIGVDDRYYINDDKWCGANSN